MPQSTYSLSVGAGQGQVVVPNSASLSSNQASDWTLCFWLKCSSAAQFDTIWSSYVGSPFYEIVSFRDDSSHLNALTSGLSAVTAADDNVWHHWAFRRSGSSVKWFCDGVLDASGSLGAGDYSSDFGRTIGNDFGGSFGDRTPTALIDDMGEWTVALSDGDIAALAAGTDPATLTTGLALLLRFEEGTGSSAADSSGNSNTGTLSGTAGWSSDVPSALSSSGFTATAAVTIGAATCSADATFTAPIYTATAPLLVGGRQSAGGAAVAFTGTSDLDVADALGLNSVGAQLVFRADSDAGVDPLVRYVVSAVTPTGGGQSTLTIAPLAGGTVTFSGSNYYPQPAGAGITCSAAATFASAGPFTATAGVTIGAATAAAAATFSPGTKTGSAAVTVGHATCAAAATFAPGTKTATASCTAGPATCAAAATFAPGTKTATAAATCGHATASGSATFAAGTKTASVACTIGPPTCAATGLFGSQIFQAAVACTAPAATCAAAATFTPGVAGPKFPGGATVERMGFGCRVERAGYSVTVEPRA